MSDIFREVDEDLRREHANQIWRKYNGLFLALAVLVVAAVVGWRLFETRRISAEEAAGARYEAASALARQGKPDEAAAAFAAIAQTGPAGYAVLARLRAAALRAATDKVGAVTAYDGIVNDGGAPALVRDAARLRAALLRVDEADLAEIRKRLASLLVSGGPFRNSAREIEALAAFRTGDYTAAGQALDAIVTDNGAAPDMRARAEALQGLVRTGKPAATR